MNTRVKLIRKEAGLTQQDFANALNISKSTVESIEYGRREMSERTLKDICRVFKVSELWLRTGEGDMHPVRTREVEIAEMTAAMYKADENDYRYRLMKLIAQMTPEQIDLFREIAEKLNN